MTYYETAWLMTKKKSQCRHDQALKVYEPTWWSPHSTSQAHLKWTRWLNSCWHRLCGWIWSWSSRNGKKEAIIVTPKAIIAVRMTIIQLNSHRNISLFLVFLSFSSGRGRQARSCRVRKLLPEVESVQCFRFDDSLIPLKGSESGWDIGSFKAISLSKMSRI